MKTIWTLYALCSLLQAASEVPDQTIELPGVRGRIDHLAVDTLGKKLFVAALGNNSLEVIDLKQGKVVHSIHNLPEPQGVAFAHDKNRIYVANGDDGTVRAFDATTYALIQKWELDSDADNLRLDASGKTIYAGFGEGGIAGLNLDSGRTEFKITLPGHPESFQVENQGKRIFVNIPDAGKIAVLDRERKVLISLWPLDDLKMNFPMALEEAHHRLWVGFRHPSVMAAFDTETGKKVFQVSIDPDVDDIFYDAAGKRVFLICGGGAVAGEGYLDVFRQGNADEISQAQRIPTSRGARTGLWVPAWNKLFLAVPARGRRHAAIRVYSFSPG
jgi:WD40 repeat protein